MQRRHRDDRGSARELLVVIPRAVFPTARAVARTFGFRPGAMPAVRVYASGSSRISGSPSRRHRLQRSLMVVPRSAGTRPGITAIPYNELRIFLRSSSYSESLISFSDLSLSSRFRRSAADGVGAFASCSVDGVGAFASCGCWVSVDGFASGSLLSVDAFTGTTPVGAGELAGPCARGCCAAACSGEPTAEQPSA